MRSQQINVTFLGLLWAFLAASSFSKIFWVVILNLDLDPQMRQVNRTGFGSDWFDRVEERDSAVICCRVRICYFLIEIIHINCECDQFYTNS